MQDMIIALLSMILQIPTLDPLAMSNAIPKPRIAQDAKYIEHRQRLGNRMKDNS